MVRVSFAVSHIIISYRFRTHFECGCSAWVWVCGFESNVENCSEHGRALSCRKQAPRSACTPEVTVHAAVRFVFVAYCLNAHIKCRPVHEEATEGRRVLVCER